MAACTHCGKNTEGKPDMVYSGDFDPFCNRACKDAYYAGIMVEFFGMSSASSPAAAPAAGDANSPPWL